MAIVKFVAILLVATTLCEARLSDHFISWLDQNGYKDYDFARDDVGGLSFGGKTGDNDTIVKQPVILVHGLTSNAYAFNETREYFKERGEYTDAEIYATTWGTPLFHRNGVPHRNGLTKHAGYDVYFSKKNLVHVRKFVEAVIAYTGAKQVDIMGHSMGVVTSRLVIKGGQQWDNETYDLGEPLTNSVDTFVGIVGLNLGSNECYALKDTAPLCNDKNGHYPGVMTGTEVVNRSEILEKVNENPGFEGSYVFSIFTIYDDVILNGDQVYCKYTSHVPDSDLDIKLTDPIYTHHSALSLTPQLQLGFVQDHVVTESFKKYIHVPNPNSC